MSIVRIPGFPNEVSDDIELPDIGELLVSPAFQGISADDYRTYATEFQKSLLDKVPLRNDRKHVIVRSGVWLLRPGTRSHVGKAGDWHIDGESKYSHIHPDERVFILSSRCSALTEFNSFPLTVECSPDETVDEFTSRLRRSPEKFGVIPQPIEPHRIYAFENHLHRAVDPKRIEFRFFFRVRETDKGPFERHPMRRLVLTDVTTGAKQKHIEYGAEQLTIYFPKL